MRKASEKAVWVYYLKRFFNVVAVLAHYAFVAFRKEPVLVIAALAAFASCVVVPPCPAYAAYVDVRVLALLLCLMLCVAGLMKAGVFTKLSQTLLQGEHTLRFLAGILVFLPFFISMLVTNDVALIIFVPFAILVLTLANRLDALAYIVVLQTIAANLGSMVTPFGNPQNLYLFTHYNLSLMDFARCLAPYAVLTVVLLLVCLLKVDTNSVSLTLKRRSRTADSDYAASDRWSEGDDGEPSGASAAPMPEAVRVESELASPEVEGADARLDRRSAVFFAALFLVSLLAVIRVLPFAAACAVVCAAALCYDRQVFKKVDWGLLATFVCFFVFVGNIGQIEGIRLLLEGWTARSAFAVSLAASQVISNVPTAVLLAPFTADWQGMLLGVDLGGLGTPIASLASLISLRFYLQVHGAKAGKYLALFTLLNVAFLAVTCGLAAVLS